ncbi:uncharacterized protein LOC126846631 [Adelges cooleyi]|uniref:uncharacterized protein LOC126846631 n=1 Tax=Adelges cooleyi TaxID=133065 RepID=UPI0021806F62|nr:uncharacterized protein LOC126846631 [Adelges cooleyi]
MKFNGLCLLSVLLVTSLNIVSGHKCPEFEPKVGFEMEKFQGLWYAIRTNLPFTRCLAYDFYPRKVKAFKPITNYQKYYGALEANANSPSEMTFTDSTQDYSNPEVKKPYFVVIDTDYEHYASVFICIKRPDGNGYIHNVSILSRSVSMDSKLLNELTVNIATAGIRKLTLVNHEDCNHSSLVENSDDQNPIDDDDDRRPYVSIKWIEPTP